MILENSLVELKLRYKQEHPKVVLVQQRTKSLSQQISFEVQRMIERQRLVYLDLQDKKKQLEKMLQEQQSRSLALQKKYLEYERHRQEANALQKTYSNMLEKIERNGYSCQYEFRHKQHS